MAPHSSTLAWKIPWMEVGCSPWGCKESDRTEWLHFHFSLSCIGEGSGNPLQCSCLENPRDGGAWWAAIYGVAQSRTRLKWFSSSSSSWVQGQGTVNNNWGGKARETFSKRLVGTYHVYLLSLTHCSSLNLGVIFVLHTLDVENTLLIYWGSYTTYYLISDIYWSFHWL